METKNESKMILKVENNTWVIEHSGKIGEEVSALFNTRTLPTPYKSNTPAQKVLKRIQKLNPEINVTLDGNDNETAKSHLD